MPAAVDRIPVTLLTGFLGSGKTTLLNAALRRSEAPIGVVVNEFGAVGIDHDLVEAANEDVVLLAGGCACCAVRSDVGEALDRLARVRAARSAPPVARVVIETTGLADPVPIEQLFVMPGAVSARHRLDHVVATVDTCLGARAAASEAVWRRQVALADALVLTKTDLASTADRAAVEALLDATNPDAERLVGTHGTSALLAPDGARTRRPWLPALRSAVHDEAVVSFTARLRRPLHPEVLTDWLDALVARCGDRLLRIKGLVNLVGEPQPLVVHAVQHLVAAPRLLAAWPTDDRDTRLVFIARGLEPGDLTAGYSGSEVPEWR